MKAKKILFPSWEVLESQNNRAVYQGYFSQQQIDNGLFLTIRCNNDSCVNHLWTDNIHIALTTENEFPIFTSHYRFCKEGYFIAIKDTCDYLIALTETLVKVKTNMGFQYSEDKFLTIKEIADMKKRPEG